MHVRTVLTLSDAAYLEKLPVTYEGDKTLRKTLEMMIWTVAHAYMTFPSSLQSYSINLAPLSHGSEYGIVDESYDESRYIKWFVSGETSVVNYFSEDAVADWIHSKVYPQVQRIPRLATAYLIELYRRNPMDHYVKCFRTTPISKRMVEEEPQPVVHIQQAKPLGYVMILNPNQGETNDNTGS